MSSKVLLGKMKSQNRISTFPPNDPSPVYVADAVQNSAWCYHITGFLPIAVLYLILGFYQIDGQSLWTDELISIGRIAADKPISTRVYSQSPIYFVLLDVWTQTMGRTEFALRSLSALLGLAAIGLTYCLAFRLFSRRTALFAAALLATSPYLIWYAQEVRYVTLTLVTSLAMTYSCHRAISTGLRRWWLLYGVTSLIALFSFVTVIFLIVAHGLYVLCCASHRHILPKWIGCQIIIIFIFSIWLGATVSPQHNAALTEAPVLTAHQQKRSHSVLPLTDLVGAIPYTFFAFSVGYSLGPSVRDLHESRSVTTLLSYAPAVVPAGLLFATLFVLGLTRLRRNKNATVFLLTWLGAPVAGVFIIATTTSYHVYNTRYAVIALPAYILCLAVGIATFRRQRVQVALLFGLLFINGLSLGHYYFDPRYAREDARSAARYLESRAQPGDIILLVGNATALKHYYKGSLPVLRAGANPTNNGSEHLRTLAKDHARVWLVEIRPWQSDPKSTVRTALNKVARRTEHKRFAGVEVYSYQTPGRML